MLRYDHARTEAIVGRLIEASERANVLRGVFATLVGAVLYIPFTWIGALFGLLVGWIFGHYLAGIINVLLEWAAQLLIAQGELIDL